MADEERIQAWLRKPGAKDYRVSDGPTYLKPIRNPGEASGLESDNEDLNKFIRDNKLKWIPYETFENIEYLAEGGFGVIYSGLYEGIEVALKVLSLSSVTFEKFLNEWKSHVKPLYSYEIINLLGFTKNNEGKYAAVMEYANEGTLRKNLEKIPKSDWKQKLFILYKISCGLIEMHDQGLIHCDLHDGNILFNIKDKTDEDEFKLDGGDDDVCISDLGLCQSINSLLGKQEEKKRIYGIMTFAAPEVLRSKPHTTASDIYSFSMIMWELTSGFPPFNDKEHDTNLAINICKGDRPEILENTPKCYENLMKECWDDDPLKRPKAFEVANRIMKWIFLSPNDDIARKEMLEFIDAEPIKPININTTTRPQGHQSYIFGTGDGANANNYNIPLNTKKYDSLMKVFDELE